MVKNVKTTRHTLKDHNLAPKKKFGQNFLVHKSTAEAIVRAAEISSTEKVVEVGVGLGALTHPLAAAAEHVFGYEIDRGIVRFHEEEEDLPENVTLIHQDILTADFHSISRMCGGSFSIVANLPYSISNPFIFKLIDNASLIKSATIMLQKEVAERLMASPNSKEYGVPTVLLASCATTRKVMTLKPGEFHPRPKIDSVVVRIDFDLNSRPTTKSGAFNFSLFRSIVRATFNHRRKTILNTLTNPLFYPHTSDKARGKKDIQNAICMAQLQPSARPETLTLDDFIALTHQLEKLEPASD